MGVCVHPDVTLRKMDEISRGHDSVVLQWMEAIYQCMEQQRAGKNPLHYAHCLCFEFGCVFHVLSFIPLHYTATIGYQIVGDNCDLHQHASHVTLSSRDTTLHWFQMYAVQHRVNGHHLADEEPKSSVEHLPLSTWMPSETDCANLREDFIILTARILLTHLPTFGWLSCAVPEAIPHQYAEEMAKKSEIVSINNAYYVLVTTLYNYTLCESMITYIAMLVWCLALHCNRKEKKC